MNAVYKRAAENRIPSFKIGGSVRFDLTLPAGAHARITDSSPWCLRVGLTVISSRRSVRIDHESHRITIIAIYMCGCHSATQIEM
jgi:hypothetical protein